MRNVQQTRKKYQFLLKYHLENILQKPIFSLRAKTIDLYVSSLVLNQSIH